MVILNNRPHSGIFPESDSQSLPFDSREIPENIEAETAEFLDSIYSPFVHLRWVRVHNGYDVEIQLKTVFNIETIRSGNEEFGIFKINFGKLFTAPKTEKELAYFAEGIRNHIKWLVNHEIDETLFVGNERPWNPHKKCQII